MDMFERTPGDVRSAIASELRLYRRLVRGQIRSLPYNTDSESWCWGQTQGLAYSLGGETWDRVQWMLIQTWRMGQRRLEVTS